MLYWEKHQPKTLVFHTEHAALPVFSCIQVRHFIAEYLGSVYIDAMEEGQGFFTFGDRNVTKDEICFTFEDLGFLENMEGELTWHSHLSRSTNS